MGKSKILITDDSKISQTVLHSIFKEYYEIAFANNGKEALEYLSSHQVDLLILDLNMPIMTGFEVLTELKRNGNKTPVIVITSDEESENEVKVLELGAIDFIIKPFNRVITFQRVNNVISKVEADRMELELKIANERALQQEKLKFISENTHTIYFETEENYQMKFIFGSSNGFSNLLKYTDFRKAIHELIFKEDIEEFNNGFRSLLSEKEKKVILCRLYLESNAPVWCRITMIPTQINDDGSFFVTGTISNENDAIITLKRNEYLAKHDTVTQLLNPVYFYEVAKKFIHKKADPLCVIAIDIKNFKLINNVFGVEYANQVLCHIADMLLITNPFKLASRINSDIFYVITSFITKDDIVNRINRFTSNVTTSLRDIKIQLTYGVYPIDDKMVEVTTMCDHAYAALSKVKKNALDNIYFYNSEMLKKEELETEIENEMEQALKEEQFEIYMQPKYDIIANHIAGAESLIRWNHPKKGLISPGVFIPLFERNDFIVKIDEYVWRKTAFQIKQWMDEGKEIFPVSVNISRKCFYRLPILQILNSIIQETGIEKKYLELEVTETLLGDDGSLIIDTLNDLSKNGFKIAMDDFGTGYSSLNLLKNAPINILKIDKKLIDDITINKSSRIVLAHVISMAKDLNYSIIAEGVEKEEQVSVLKQLGCFYIQGFYYYRPLKIEDISQLLVHSYTTI